MDRKAKAQSFKNKRMGRITGRKSMPNVSPVRDPRQMGIKNPAQAGEAKTQMERRVTAQSGSNGQLGPRPDGYRQSHMPGLLNG